MRHNLHHSLLHHTQHSSFIYFTWSPPRKKKGEERRRSCHRNLPKKWLRWFGVERTYRPVWRNYDVSSDREYDVTIYQSFPLPLFHLTSRQSSYTSYPVCYCAFAYGFADLPCNLHLKTGTLFCSALFSQGLFSTDRAGPKELFTGWTDSQELSTEWTNKKLRLRSVTSQG